MSDLISRDEAIDVVQKWFDRIKLNGDICIDGLRSLSSAKPERKRGKWIGIDDYPHEDWECNRCGGIVYETQTPYEEYKYCPNCGAKMEVDK